MTPTQSLIDHIATAREDGCDAARLVLADHLRDAGDEDRADLIQVQVELGRIHCPWHPGGRNPGRCGDAECRSCALQDRERELTTRNPAWLSVPCPECEATGKIYYSDSRVESGRLWSGDYCQLCGGTGDLLRRRAAYERDTLDGTETVHETKHVSELTRGFLTVTLPHTLCWRECPECDGGGRVNSTRAFRYTEDCQHCDGTGTIPHPVLKAILRSPVGIWVEAVRVSDRVPIDEYPHSSGDPARGGWGWRDEGLENGPENIPSALLTGDVALIHPTADAATDAVSRAVPRWARARLEKP